MTEFTASRYNSAQGRKRIFAYLFAGALLSPSTAVIVSSPLINVSRLFILGSLVWVVIGYVKSLLRLNKVSLVDIAVVLFSIQVLASTAQTEGVARMLTTTAVFVLEFAGCYFLTRAFFASSQDRAILMKAFVTVICTLVGVAVIDVATGAPSIINVAANLFGTVPIPAQYRFGIVRAVATLEHAILYGIACSIGLGIALIAIEGALKKLAYASVMIIGVGLSLSAGPTLSTAILLSLFSYGVILRRVRSKWLLLALFLCLGATMVGLSTGSTAEFVIDHLTFEAQTAEYRMLIWKYVGEEIQSSPWVGIGYRDWARPSDMSSSVDSLWLVISLTFGMPATIFLAAIFLSAILSTGAHPTDDHDLVEKMGLSLILFSLGFVGLTVHFWGSVWMMIAVVVALRVNADAAPSTQPNALQTKVAVS